MSESATPLAVNGTRKQTLAEVERLERGLVPHVATMHTAAPLPARIGKYEIESKAGTGQSGHVFKCYDRELDRYVAIKIPLAESAPSGLREQFLQEARAAAKVTHEYVCEIYEIGQDGSRPYIVMPFVEGGTLADRMARDPLMPVSELLCLVRDVARGLDAIHQKGLIHRDLKPSNILCDAQGVRITDFGLAKPNDTTSTDVINGTPRYMSPEQWRPGGRYKVGPQSDVYSLGVILFQLLTGTEPFPCSDGDPLALGILVCTESPRVPSQIRPNLDSRLDALCLKALEKIPSDRYSSATGFADAISLYLQTAEANPAVPTTQVAVPHQTKVELRGQAELERGKDYYFGRGVSKDYTEAHKWWGKAALQGHAEAQHCLATLYHHGHGVQQDDAKASKWYMKAASRGCDAAYFSLLAIAAPAGSAEMREWYEKAAKLGSAAAPYILGELYFLGLGVPRDLSMARKWWEKAAARGSPEAQHRLGYVYQYEGGKRDSGIAREWYEKAANQGYAPAQNSLALIYVHVGQYTAARAWFEKSARQENASAQYNLGHMHEHGLGVEPDDVEASEWYAKAAAQGNENAEKALERIKGKT